MNKTFLFLLAILILGGNIVSAQTNSASHHGTTLLIHGKHRLNITTQTTALIKNELGEQKRDQLFMDMILGKDAKSLLKIYGSKPETLKIISLYSNMVTKTPPLAQHQGTKNVNMAIE